MILTIQYLQIILPIYFIILICYIRKLILLIVNKIPTIKLNNNVLVLSYNKKFTKNILIINGGGLIIDDATDIIIANNILPYLKEYNIISIKYKLFNNYTDTLNEILNIFASLLNLNIEIFIGDSIGCTFLLDLFKIYNQYINKKVIFISPIINYNISCNNNIKKDILNILFYNYIKNKYFNNVININYNTIPKIFIICSSNEIFYNDIIKFYNNIRNQKELHVIKNGIHSEYICYGLTNLSKDNNIITNKIVKFVEA
jgi:hypothetical protein